MRMRLVIVGLVPVLGAVASCATFHEGAARGGPRSDPPRLASEPLCSYRVLGTISGRLNEPSHTGRGSPSSQARALGADAVIGYVPTPHYDARGNLLETSWTALAIAYWDRSDPSCYSDPAKVTARSARPR